MEKKITIKEFKNHIICEAKKLYKIEELNEEKNKLEKEIHNLNEGNDSIEFNDIYMSPETLKMVRQELLKRAAGWAIKK